MYFADLTPYSYFRGREIPNILNIGWLDIQQQFSKGKVATVYLEKLKEIRIARKVVNKTRGSFSCQFCEEATTKLEAEGKVFSFGFCEIWIPTDSELIYAAPDMIYHYITAHEYQPPQEFLDALLEVTFPENWGDEWVDEEVDRRLGIAP